MGTPFLLSRKTPITILQVTPSFSPAPLRFASLRRLPLGLQTTSLTSQSKPYLLRIKCQRLIAQYLATNVFPIQLSPNVRAIKQQTDLLNFLI